MTIDAAPDGGGSPSSAGVRSKKQELVARIPLNRNMALPSIAAISHAAGYLQAIEHFAQHATFAGDAEGGILVFLPSHYVDHVLTMGHDDREPEHCEDDRGV